MQHPASLGLRVDTNAKPGSTELSGLPHPQGRGRDRGRGDIELLERLGD
jgi:hypothetical protein